MNRLRPVTAAIACLLALLMFASAVPRADAFEDPSENGAFGESLGKGSVDDALRTTRITEDPVGLAAGRGFNPTGTVATAFYQGCSDPDYADSHPAVCDPDYGNGGDDDDDPPEPPTATATPTPTATPDPKIAEGIAFERAHAEAVEWLNKQEAGFDIAPPKRGQVVHLRNFMWIVKGWETATFDSTEEGIKVTITVTPTNSIWRLEEQLSGRSFEYLCDGNGHEYGGDPDVVSTCGHTFDHSSSVVGDVVLTTAVLYELTVVSTLEDSRSNYIDGQTVPPSPTGTINLDDTDDASSKAIQFPLWVNEVLTWGIRDAGQISAPEYDGDPVVPEDGYNCGWRENVAYYATVGLPLRALGVTCGDAFGLLDTLKNGIVACGNGIARSLGDIVSLLVGAVTDPVGTVKEGIAGVKALIEMAEDDPAAFGSTVMLGMLGIDKAEWDAAPDNGTRIDLAIEGICGVAFEMLLGGAAKRIFNLLPIGKRPGRGEVEGPAVCRIASSFPTGTPVRMGSGELVPIEQVQPGDFVLAADPETGQWSNQLVLDQWAYLDTDQMTTATLADGSAITATDHHLFWVDSEQQWVELEHVVRGDHLLAPTGVVTVVDVITAPQSETLVWELDTAVHDSFTVNTGTTDLLVHNADCTPETRTRLNDEFGIDTDRISGNGARLDKLLEDIDSGDLVRMRSARAELNAIKRAQANGSTVELMPELGPSGVRNPDFRIDGKLADAKSVTNTTNGIKKAVADVNDQIKNSSFPNELGEAIIELSGDTVDFGDLNRQVRRNFNPNRGGNLDTVSIVDNAGNLIGQWVRQADGSVVQVVGG